MQESPNSPLIYLEDLTVGDVFVSKTHALDAAQIIAFAAQFDPQPFHLDAQAARDTLFQGLAASGWHTAALTMKLLVDSFPVSRGVIGAGAEVAWPQPTRPDDVIKVTSTVLSITPSRSKPDRAIVVVESITSNQRDEALQKLTSKVVVFRRP
ncbi:MaoC family dehydratase [Achromobacter arsenitoxydans]|uniref:MaoC domain-containing protein dehydratase n=1 Tax=Achromobacter arsenitoxydans SY8 TaxID=477184 RepID=H0F4S1_9BURK|nr:MaoC family dehydratase [Achromobacter arsenitoxydans]EHK66722.1 MaoC domain-containing protein dehydratase [Achromobacter arsenitoxydans SY8]